MNSKLPWWGVGIVSLGLAAWSFVAAQSADVQGQVRLGSVILSANGNPVGELVGLNGVTNNPVVAFDGDIAGGGRRTFLEVNGAGFRAEVPAIYFAGPGCTGQAYLAAPEARRGLGAMSGIAYAAGPWAGGDIHLYRANVADGSASAVVGSRYVSGSGDSPDASRCEPAESPGALVVATPVVNLSTEFPPRYSLATGSLPSFAGRTSSIGVAPARTAVSDAEVLGSAVERALVRYFETVDLPFAPGGELAVMIAQEIGGSSEPAAAPRKVRNAVGRRIPPDGPITNGVFVDDVELSLTETGSGSSDKVQLVFRTPEFGGTTGSDAWAIIVDAEDSVDPDDGKMFFSTPSFSDALQLFTDGSAIVGEQREMKLRPRSSPPIACTSFLQEGMFYWDQTISALCVCNGSSWKPVDNDEPGSCS